MCVEPPRGNIKATPRAVSVEAKWRVKIFTTVEMRPPLPSYHSDTVHVGSSMRPLSARVILAKYLILGS